MLLVFVELDTTKRCLPSLRRDAGLDLVGRQQSHTIQVDYWERRVDIFPEAASVQLVCKAQPLVVSSQKLTSTEVISELWIGDNVLLLWVPEIRSPEFQGGCEIHPIVGFHRVLPIFVARRCLLGDFAERGASRTQPSDCGRDRGRTNGCVDATESMAAYCSNYCGYTSNWRLVRPSHLDGRTLATMGGVCCWYGVGSSWYGGAGKSVTADRADYERKRDEWLRFSPPSSLFRAERQRLCHCCFGRWRVVVIAGATLIAGTGSSTENGESAGRSVVASRAEYVVYSWEKVALVTYGSVVLLFGFARCMGKQCE